MLPLPRPAVLAWVNAQSDRDAGMALLANWPKASASKPCKVTQAPANALEPVRWRFLNTVFLWA